MKTKSLSDKIIWNGEWICTDDVKEFLRKVFLRFGKEGYSLGKCKMIIREEAGGKLI